MTWLLMMPVRFLRLLLQSILLALSQIWANKVRSLLTTIGIVIGVASVTAVIASLTGLKAKILSDIETFGTNNIYIWPNRPDRGRGKNLSWRRLRFSPEQFDGLLDHCPSVERYTLICWGGERTMRYGEKSMDGIRVYGIEPSWHDIENRQILLGRPISVIDQDQGRNVCLIDPQIRDKLNLDRDCIGDIVHMNSMAYRIIGILEKRPEMSFIGGVGGGGEAQSEVFIPLNNVLKYDTPWIWSIAASKTTDVSEDAQAEIKFYLRKMRDVRPGEPDTFGIQSVQSEIKKFNEIAMVITLVASGVVGVSLLVGGVGIMNIMLVSVSERTREIGLRKAVGARRSAILTQFLVEAVVLCLLGGVLGIGFGQLLTLGISNIPGANLEKAAIPMWAIGIAFGFSAFVGVFFGMFPAMKAARLDPIEALRHE